MPSLKTGIDMKQGESTDISVYDMSYKKWYAVLLLICFFQCIVFAVTAGFNIFDIKILSGEKDFIDLYPVMLVLWLLITVCSCVCAVLSKDCSINEYNKRKKFFSLKSRFICLAVASFILTAVIGGAELYAYLTSDVNLYRKDEALANGESLVVIISEDDCFGYDTVSVYKQYGILVKKLKDGRTVNGKYDITYDKENDCGVLTVYHIYGDETVPYECGFDI